MGSARMSSDEERTLWSMTGSSVCSRRNDHRLDALVELAGEDVVALADVFEREAVGDDVLRVDVPGLDVLDAARQVALDTRLVGADRQALVHGVADRDEVEGRPVGADDGDDAALPHRVDGPV